MIRFSTLLDMHLHAFNMVLRWWPVKQWIIHPKWLLADAASASASRSRVFFHRPYAPELILNLWDFEVIFLRASKTSIFKGVPDAHALKSWDGRFPMAFSNQPWPKMLWLPHLPTLPLPSYTPLFLDSYMAILHKVNKPFQVLGLFPSIHDITMETFRYLSGVQPTVWIGIFQVAHVLQDTVVNQRPKRHPLITIFKKSNPSHFWNWGFMIYGLPGNNTLLYCSRIGGGKFL